LDINVNLLRILVPVAAGLLCSVAAYSQTMIGGGKTPPTFPITINQPGSYKLGSNLAVPAGSVGILITAPNVTLDLNGFTLSGPATCSAAGVCSMPPGTNHGISAPGLNNIVVRNGTVTGFQGNGLNMLGSAQLEDLTVSQNVGYGLYTTNMTAVIAQVHRVRSTLNKLSGMYVYGGIVTQSSATANGQNGFYVNQSSIFDSMSTDNLVNGVFVGSHGLLRGVRAATNAGGNFAGSYTSAGGNMNDWTLF
jgi:hypothetical protein